MQLSKLKISNIFNFPYQSDLENFDGVSFSHLKQNNVNILIGPNGAGKSTFLNVINWVWKIGLEKDFIFHKDLILKQDPTLFDGVIVNQELTIPKVRKHFDFSDKESCVYVEFLLTQHDYENISFILKNRQKINSIIAKYSKIDLVFADIDLDLILKMNKLIKLKFDIDVDNKTVSLVENNLNAMERFVLDSVRNIELIQLCINIYNEFEKNESDRKRYPLKHSVALLGLKRNLKNISNHISPEAWHNSIADKNSSKYESFVGFSLCARRIWDILTHASEENVYKKINITDFSNASILKKLGESKFFKSLVSAIDKYIKKNLVIEYEKGKLVFWLLDEFGHRLTFDDLSDGEQSLLIMIFTIYGYDLKYGMLIVDEPELYFHPQMQRDFVNMTEKISDNIGTQFIISTYSPLFVDDKNIANVYKFRKDIGEIKITNPDFDFTPSESALIHLLKFENMSKMFFVNKIIMVEGDTDQYFFEFYLKYLNNFPKRKSLMKEYEIININGKGSYKSWRHFLAKFGIQSYFIGDWDNIVDFGIFSQEELSSYYKDLRLYMSKIKRSNKTLSPYYARLVNMLRDVHPEKYALINIGIKELYKKDIFILQRGDLETYIGTHHKGLEDTVAFCNDDFDLRLKNRSFDEHRKNLDMILGHIFGSEDK